VIDDLAQLIFQLNPFRRVQIAFENGVLEMVAKVATRFEGSAQSLIIGDIVANKIDGAHDAIIRNSGWETGNQRKVGLHHRHKAEGNREKPSRNLFPHGRKTVSENAEVPGNQWRTFPFIKTGGEEGSVADTW
jgi:hypothetical protein